MKTAQRDSSVVRLAIHSLLVALCCWLPGSSISGATDEPSLAGALEILHAVGPEGRGNVDAAGAWATVVKKASAKTIPLLLAQFGDANELAANWIRGAIDAIAERELARGGKLPMKRLEDFVLNKNHPPRARRLAFEWVIRVDPDARVRIIAGMLHDPGADFRRDAVEHGWLQAEAANATGETAIATYRKLMSAARDDDQVNKIRKRLKELGVEIDLPRHFGYVTKWNLVGPFDNTDERGLEIAYPPEREIKLGASYDGKSGEVEWIDHETSDDYGKVDLNRAIGRTKGVLAYAHHEFWSEANREAEIRLSTVNAWRVWLNGELLYTRDEYHHGTQFDHYRVKARLRPGKNVILLKVCQNELQEKYADPWKFQLRVCDTAGTAILSTRATKAAKKERQKKKRSTRRGKERAGR